MQIQNEANTLPHLQLAAVGGTAMRLVTIASVPALH